MLLILRSAFLFLQSSLKKKSAEIIEAVEGFNMTQEQKERVRIVQGAFR